MRFKRIIFFILTLCSSLLVGCVGQNTSSLFYETQGNVADVRQKVTAARHLSDQQSKPTSALKVDKGMYIDKTPIDLEQSPTWLKRYIVIRGNELPFSYYARTIVGSQALTHYQSDMNLKTPITLNYAGTVRGALDLLASKTGNTYIIDGNDVSWQEFVTKTFSIAFMPGSSDYLVGKDSSSGSAGGTPAGGAAGSTGSVSQIQSDTSSSEYSNIKGTLSVWKDLQSAIKEMLSPQGRVMVSESTTSVTVRDRPNNIEIVSKFIDNLNNNLSQQVLVKIQVLEVNLESDYDYGIDWGLVKKSMGVHFGFAGNASEPLAITALGNNGASGMAQAGAKWDNGSSLIIKALKQQGSVSTVTEPRVICLNNQVSEVRLVNQQGYIASIQNTTQTGLQTSTTSQVTPGTVVSGLTLYILPKIIDDKVIMQVSADLSTLVSIDDLYSSGNGTKESEANAIKIQAPKLTSKQFNQRTVVHSGDTLILSGFRQVSNTANASQVFNSQALGGQAAQQLNSETIILLTPIVLHGIS